MCTKVITYAYSFHIFENKVLTNIMVSVPTVFVLFTLLKSTFLLFHNRCFTSIVTTQKVRARTSWQHFIQESYSAMLQITNAKCKY